MAKKMSCVKLMSIAQEAYRANTLLLREVDQEPIDPIERIDWLNESLSPVYKAIFLAIENFSNEINFSWHRDSKKRGWKNETAEIVVSLGSSIHIPIPLKILISKGLETKVRSRMNEFYALKVHPKEKATFLDADTNRLVTRPQGLVQGAAVLMRLLPRIEEDEAKRLLTEGGLIQDLDYPTARHLQFELDKFEAQYVKSVIQLTVSIDEALAVINRPAEGNAVCNNDWGKDFLINPFGVLRRILEVPDFVEAKPFATPHSVWRIGRGGEQITLWHYHSGMREVELDIDGKHGMTWVRYDDELAFLVRKAVEECSDKELNAKRVKLFGEELSQ